MYILNNKEIMDGFKTYCLDNYNTYYSDRFFNLFKNTMLQIDIETYIIEKLDAEKVIKSYGNYNSEIVIILERYNKDVLDVLDKIFKKVFNKDLYEFHVIYYEKTNFSKDTLINDINTTDVYNLTLYKELSICCAKYVINFTDIVLEYEGICTHNIANYIERLAILYNKKDLTNEESYTLKTLKTKLWTILKSIVH